METQSLIDSLHAMHSRSSLPFVIFDSSFRIILENEAFSRYFGNYTNGFDGKKLDFFMLKDKEPFESIATLTEEQLSRYSGVIFCVREGLESNFCVSVFPVCNEPGKKYFYAIFKDTSDIEQNIVEKSLYALIKASLLKDNDTGNHIKRVNEYARILSDYLLKTRTAEYPDVNPFFINKIAYVSAMHDIGKIGTPDSILTKPGPLTADEFNIIKEHTINGAFILSSLAGEMARDIALFHHERWDGSGYPYKLKGTEIPVSARIVSVADVYDALRMKRHYKDAMSHTQAKEIVERKSGRHFDPEIVEAFLEIHLQFERIYNENSDSGEDMGFLEELEEVL